MNGGQRGRNYPNGPGSGRLSNESRRPPGAPGGASSSAASSSRSGMSRAEKFEDERKRITSSCFAKVDAEGQLEESYITHIRITEDGAHPQSPAPPISNPATRKARVIVIAVTKLKMVRLHKARENANTTFSIGKTWELFLLSAVENFTSMIPKDEQEAQHKQWAGDTGFVVTIGKPYYWEASTPKEKEFFIGSLVKIYSKFTDKYNRRFGKYPALTGFDQAELAGLTEGRPYAATEQGRAAFDRWMRPFANSEQEPSPNDPGPYAEFERRPEDSRSLRPPPRSPQPPLSSPAPDAPRVNSPDGRRLPPPRGVGRPPTADGQPRDRLARQNASPSMPNMREATAISGGTVPLSPRPPANGLGTPPVPASIETPRPRPSIESNLRPTPSREDFAVRSAPSRERVSPGPNFTPPMHTPSQRLSPQSSRSELRPKTSDTTGGSPIPAGLNVNRTPISDAPHSQISQRSIAGTPFDGADSMSASSEERRANGLLPTHRRDLSPKGLRPGTAQSNRSMRPGTSQSNASSTYPPIETPSLDDYPPKAALPERRRPQMEPTSSQHSPRSLGAPINSPQTDLQTPTQTPSPSLSPAPVAPPPRRRPQELPERQKPTVHDVPLATSDSSRSVTPAADIMPPPASTLPPQLRTTQTEIPSSTQPVVLTNSDTDREKLLDDQISPKATEDAVIHRPGLGPMIKKNTGKIDAASTFRKAAVAAGAFKPRARGGAAKLFAQEAKPGEASDGINGVFVPQRPTTKEDERKVDIGAMPMANQTSKERPTVVTEAVPELKVSSPTSPPTIADNTNLDEVLSTRAVSPDLAGPKVEPDPEPRRKRRRSNQQMMNISKLGIDPHILDGQGLDFEIMLSEFGWGSSELSSKTIESMEYDIRREIARVEAGSWLNHLEQKDDRVEAVEKMLDRAIAECEELEGLLTLYNVELSSLNDDVAFIEAQGQGLQVQTANQKLLQTELRQLVDTISITPDQLESLRRAPIGKASGLAAIEASLVLLYKALITIDPTSVAGHGASTSETLTKINNNSGLGGSELASMQALQEKKDRYLNESAMFLDRLKKHMDITFGAAFMQTKDVLAAIDQRAKPSTKANIEAHDAGRSTLWMLRPVVLFAKEIDRASWDALISTYQNQAGALYQGEIRDNILAWKRFARKPTGEELELLFTAQEKESETITGAARKLTVKRSQTLARGLRAASGDKESKLLKAQDGKLFAYDVFARVLEDMSPILLTEQNFITEFFHATSTEAVDFPEAVQAAPPESRRGPDLSIRKQFEADRTIAKRVAEVMEDIFSFWPTELQNLVEWAVKADPLQGIGILYAVNRKLVEVEDSNQDFLTKNLQKIHERLTGLFNRFVAEQIRAIEDTKVKIKKRRGVIAFMKTFPHFAVAIENMLPVDEESSHLEIRKMVDDAYQKINKAMYESLKVIAKESPAVMANQGQGDPEDKEALNYHILLIENMNHYVEEVDDHQDAVLLEWKTKAQDEMSEHMNLYVDAVVRRPLGKLLEFMESTETLLAQSGTTASSIAQRSSHSKNVFKKLVHAYDAKEIRKGIEALKKRVDKHFGDADDPSISRDLVFKVLKDCEKKYGNVHERLVSIGQDVYSGEVELDWGVNEVTAAFRR